MAGRFSSMRTVLGAREYGDILGSRRWAAAAILGDRPVVSTRARVHRRKV
jgi:hypothetical protein